MSEMNFHENDDKCKNLPLKITPEFNYICLICNERFYGLLSSIEEDCTHFWNVENDEGNIYYPICIDCKELLEKLNPELNMFRFLYVTKPLFLDGSKLELINE